VSKHRKTKLDRESERRMRRALEHQVEVDKRKKRELVGQVGYTASPAQLDEEKQ